MSDNTSWIIGVVLAILADVFTNTGTNLQKLAHTRIDEEMKKKKRGNARARQSINSPVAQQVEHHGSIVSSSHQPSIADPSRHMASMGNIPPSPSHAGGVGSPTPTNPSAHISPLVMSPTDSDGTDSNLVRTPSFTGTAAKKEKPNYCTSPIWVLGVALLIGGAIGDFLALGFAAQSTVAPLGSLTLVVNMFMARWMHGERITPLGVIATVCIVAGSFLTIAFANHNTFQYSIQEIFDLYTTTRFIVYAIVMCSSIGTMWYLVRKWDKDPQIKSSPMFPLYKLFFAALNGTIGGHNVLFAKFTVEIFAMGQFKAFTYFLFYITFGLMIACVLTQVKWLNEGLKRFDAIFMVPVSTAFWVFFSAFSGIITFAEYNVMTWFEIIYFCIGIMLILMGVLVFTRTKTNNTRKSISPEKTKSRLSQHESASSPLTQHIVGVDEESPNDMTLDQPAKGLKNVVEQKLHRNYQTLSPKAE